MKYAIVGKTGKLVKTFKTLDKAERILTRLNEPGASIVEVAPSIDAAVKTAGLYRRYNQATIDRFTECMIAGHTAPKYALYMDGVLLAYFKSEEDAKFVRRKARGFAKRVLGRRFRFTVKPLHKSLVSVAAG